MASPARSGDDCGAVTRNETSISWESISWMSPRHIESAATLTESSEGRCPAGPQGAGGSSWALAGVAMLTSTNATAAPREMLMLMGMYLSQWIAGLGFFGLSDDGTLSARHAGS